MHPYILIGLASIVISIALILVALLCNMCYQICRCILCDSNDEFMDSVYDTFELSQMNSVVMNIHDDDGL